MSKKRNISRKVSVNSNFPLPEEILPNLNHSHPQDAYFGEKINGSVDSASTRESDFSDFYLSDDVFYSRGSESSTSESEDLENEASQVISAEFEKVENILYGDREPPANEKHEYQQWMNNFPHLRVVGKKMTILPDYEEVDEDLTEEVIVENYDAERVSEVISDHSADIKNRIKETVIKNVLSDVKSALDSRFKTNKIFSDYSAEELDCTRRPKETLNPKCDQKNETYLQIPPAPLTSSAKQRSSNYRSPIMKSHMSASKWQKQDDEYSSLPLIPNFGVPSSSKKETLSANKLDRASSNFRRDSAVSEAKLHSRYTQARNKSLVLPPIQNLTLDGDVGLSTFTPRRTNSSKFQKFSHEKNMSNF